MRRYLIGFGDVSPATAPAILPATCELRWDILVEERMMQYSRDKYFPQLRTKVINLVGEPSKIPLSAPAHTQKQTLAPNANKRVVNPLSGCLQGLILIVIDRKVNCKTKERK